MVAQIVSFHCVLKNNFGKIIGTTFNNEVLVANKKDDKILQGLVEGLKGIRTGEKRKVSLRAEQAYGFYDPQLIIERQLEDLDLPNAVRSGEMIIYSHNGRQQFFRVLSIHDDRITLDGNHPLAGQDLVFEIIATDAREATADDLDQTESFGSTVTFH